MKKNVVVASAVAAIALIIGAYAVYGDADITGDPLVSLSYINEVLWPKIENAISAAVSGKTFDSNDKEENGDTSVSDKTGESSETQNADYQVLYMASGEILVAKSSCEIILRSGSAVVHLGGNESGIADLTDGVDLADGISVPANHLLLIPRADGRGIKVESQDAYVMVRGGYEIVKE